MHMKLLVNFVISAVFFGVASKGYATDLGLVTGANGNPALLLQALAMVSPGSVVVIGEQHGTNELPIQHMQILNHLRSAGLKVSVGMEFFSWTDQSLLSDYWQGRLLEEDLLQKVGWGKGFPFSSYREQVLFPNSQESFVRALNSPRWLTSRISKVGVKGLTADELQFMPPLFQIGNLNYFERFKEIMSGGHLPENALERYFEAQSTWDDTMAWQASEFLKSNPDQVLVIIVGEFHVQYGGGLTDRLKKRGLNQVLSISQINVNGLPQDQALKEILPHPIYGPRADYIWLSDFPSTLK
jgi:uncharacterized iron-regulated protein